MSIVFMTRRRRYVSAHWFLNIALLGSHQIMGCRICDYENETLKVPRKGETKIMVEVTMDV